MENQLLGVARFQESSMKKHVRQFGGFFWGICLGMFFVFESIPGVFLQYLSNI